MEHSILTYEKQKELLNELSFGKEYFFSERILSLMVDRCRWILSETDRILNEYEKKTYLQTILAKFSFVERTFLIRSTPIRYEIERLGKNFKDIQKLECFAKNMESTFISIINSADTEKKIFSTKNIVIDSYPLLTIAFDPDEPGLIDESILLKKYYYEVYQGDFADGLLFQPFSNDKIALLIEVLNVMRILNKGMIADVAIYVRHFCIMSVPAFGNKGLNSFNFSSRHLLGACFLSEQTFSSFALLLEAVYHETLHLKFFNTFLCKKIFIDDPNSEPATQFECPWIKNGADHYWNLDRVFAAFHVYVHLHVLYALFSHEVSISVIPNDRVQERLSVCNYKGHILMEWLDKHLLSRLTDEGKVFYFSLSDIFRDSVSLENHLSF